MPLGPNRGQISQPVATAVHARPSIARSRIHIPNNYRRNSRTLSEPVIIQEEVHEDEPSHDMDVEEENKHQEHECEQLIDLREVETMVGIEEDDAEQDVAEQDLVDGKPAKMWPDMDTPLVDRCQKRIEALRETYEDVVNMYDTAMVSEYSEDIFEYMADLEVGDPPI